MCGFSGILFSSASAQADFAPGLAGFRQAAERVAHRGDTDHNEYLQGRLWLSHYRLAFQDLQAGAQPMRSEDGEHVIIFNGEVYNHLQLRPAIERAGYAFRTRSDTETLLQGYRAFGTDFFSRLDGEFAFVILRTDGRELIAHRDHFGVKPLFLHLEGVDNRRFACHEKRYVFTCPSIEVASEIKGLASPKRWNREGLLRQFVGLYEPVCTPFDNIIQLPPGAVLEARRQGDHFDCLLHTRTTPIRNQARHTPPASLDDFEAVFRESVADRLLSDVELGVYLSGGVDSKAVAYELSRTARTPIKSFTVGFTQAGYDESAEALDFARHLGFAPHLLTIDDAALNYAYPLAVQTSEVVQPYTNGSAKWWLSHFTRQYVSGVLTGDGADEVLCGYPSYRYASWWKQAMRSRGPATSVEAVLALLDRFPLGSKVRDGLYMSRFSAHGKNPWLSGSSAAGTGQDFVDSLRLLGIPHPLFGQIQAISRTLLGEQADDWLAAQGQSLRSWYGAGFDEPVCLADPEQSLLLWQNYFAKTHLPVLILNWVGDRMEMSNTLEGRTPFLSKKMRELIRQQPDRALISGLKDKVLLRQSYARRFPAAFAHKPKKQFNAPFLADTQLMNQYDTRHIFSQTGLGDDHTLTQLLQAIDQHRETDPYLATHLQSTCQTAICLSIVHHSLVENRHIERDRAFEQGYLDKGGPVLTSDE